MPNNLSDSQSSVLRSIFGAAPDSAVSSLESALAGEVARGGAMAAVHGLIAQEAANRRTRSFVFLPFMPLCRPGRGPYPRFSAALPGLLWTALREVSPGAARAAEALGPCENEDDHIFAADICDSLCRTALAGLRAADPPFAAARALLDEIPGQTDQFLRVLELAPLVRSAVARLPVWMGRLNEEKAVAIRLSYNDAADLTEDGGPRLLEIISAHMAEPWRVLQLISAIMDRPNDRFAAASEIARFGDYLMDDIDHRLAEFRAYDPSQGRAAGTAAAAVLHNASLEIAEFETSLELSRDGPWGGRIAKQKQSVAQLAEARLALIDKALDGALPVMAVKFGKGVRGFPKLNEDPQPPMLRKAESLLAFFLASRASANQAGFGSSRTKAGERMDGRIDQYVEDLLELMRADEVPNLARIKAYLNVAADLIAIARGDQAAAIIRRRAAA